MIFNILKFLFLNLMFFKIINFKCKDTNNFLTL